MTRISTYDTPWGEDIIVYGMPKAGKPVNIAKCAILDNTAVFIDDQGKLYCPRIKAGYHHSIGSVFGATKTLLNGLVSLGKITRKQADQYEKEGKERESRRTARYQLEYLDTIIAQHGLKISAARAKVAKAAGVIP